MSGKQRHEGKDHAGEGSGVWHRPSTMPVIDGIPPVGQSPLRSAGEGSSGEGSNEGDSTSPSTQDGDGRKARSELMVHRVMHQLIHLQMECSDLLNDHHRRLRQLAAAMASADQSKASPGGTPSGNDAS